jgi:SSS family solute:Na+ symporter
VTIAGVMLPEDSTPDNSIIAYLNDIGFQAFYFFGVFVGAASLMLISNAKDNLQNPKAMPIDLSLFTTSKGYLYGTLAVCLITALMYVYWW